MTATILSLGAGAVGTIPAVPQNLFPDLGLAGPLEWSPFRLVHHYSHHFPQCLWEIRPTQPRTQTSTLEVY